MRDRLFIPTGGSMKTTKEWYVASVQISPLDTANREYSQSYDCTKPSFIYLFGGTLEEVKNYIQNVHESMRSSLTWVSSEFVEEHLFNNITYSI